jgi:hypothetical protein
MRLAANELVIRVGEVPLRLRPTLRAACRLERRYGLDGLIGKIADGNLTIMADVIAESSSDPSEIPDVLCRLARMPLRTGLEVLQVTLLRHVYALAGVDPDAPKQPASTGPKITFAEYHTQLFRIATGWLGWTPETAWNATPAEIEEAHQGRLEMLRALFGSKEESDSPSMPPEHSDAEVKEGLFRLKIIAAAGGNVARR